VSGGPDAYDAAENATKVASVTEADRYRDETGAYRGCRFLPPFLSFTALDPRLPESKGRIV
jgi:hypothetical protein